MKKWHVIIQSPTICPVDQHRVYQHPPFIEYYIECVPLFSCKIHWFSISTPWDQPDTPDSILSTATTLDVKHVEVWNPAVFNEDVMSGPWMDGLGVAVLCHHIICIYMPYGSINRCFFRQRTRLFSIWKLVHLVHFGVCLKMWNPKKSRGIWRFLGYPLSTIFETNLLYVLAR